MALLLLLLLASLPSPSVNLECHVSTVIDGKSTFSGSAICDERTDHCMRTKKEHFEMTSCAPWPVHSDCVIKAKCPPLSSKGDCCCKDDDCNNGSGGISTALALVLPALIYLIV